MMTHVLCFTATALDDLQVPQHAYTTRETNTFHHLYARELYSTACNWFVSQRCRPTPKTSHMLAYPSCAQCRLLHLPFVYLVNFRVPNKLRSSRHCLCECSASCTFLMAEPMRWITSCHSISDRPTNVRNNCWSPH